MKKLVYKLFLICLLAVFCLLPLDSVRAEVVERVVAVVDDDVILLTEFREALRRVKESGEKADEKKIIEEMINEILLLEQAEKFSFSIKDIGAGDDEIIRNYINKRIKALIYIPFREIEAYYYNNLEKYSEMDFDDVKKEIEKYLINMTLEIRLQEHIDELRENVRIRVQLD